MIERVAILSTGDEITTGKVVDTNANYIADKFVEAGMDVAARNLGTWFRARKTGLGFA